MRIFAYFAGLLAVFVPKAALAAIAISSALGSSQSNSAGHSITTGTFTAGANTTVVATGDVNGLNNAADVLSLTDNTAGALGSWTVVQCATTGATTKTSYIAYAFTSAGFTSKTVTMADTAVGGTNWASGASLVVFGITGGATTSVEDIAARACNGTTVATGSPSLASGAPTGSGELFMSNYNGQRATSGASYTADAGHGWSALYGPFGGSHAADSGVSQVNAGSGALTDNPAVTSAAYVQQIMAFCPSGGCTGGAAPSFHGLAAIGAGR